MKEIKNENNITLKKTNSEKEEMIEYCLRVLDLAPKTTPEYQLAKIALIRLKDEENKIIEICKEIQMNANKESVQYKISKLIINDQIKTIEPDGWQLVPKDPTNYENDMFQFVPLMPKMIINQDEYDRSKLNQRNATWIYQNMLKYAPKFNIDKN